MQSSIELKTMLIYITFKTVFVSICTSVRTVAQLQTIDCPGNEISFSETHPVLSASTYGILQFHSNPTLRILVHVSELPQPRDSFLPSESFKHLWKSLHISISCNNFLNECCYTFKRNNSQGIWRGICRHLQLPSRWHFKEIIFVSRFYGCKVNLETIPKSNTCNDICLNLESLK